VNDLNGFDIQILDDDNNLINFNNVYWTITMLLEMEYIEQEIQTNKNTNFGLPTQGYWGADPNIAFGDQQDQPIDEQPIDEQPTDQNVNEPAPTEDQPTDQNVDETAPTDEQPYLQAEPPNYEIQDPTSLEELLIANGIYQ